MADSNDKPNSSNVAELNEKKFKSAAKAITEADVLLLVTGAGWSADSGLPVYNDIARIPAYEERGLTYADVAKPAMLENDPSLFYGFWGQALYDYRNTVPHAGHAIVDSWRRDKMKNEYAKQVHDRIQTKLNELGNANGTNEACPFGAEQNHSPFEDLPISDMAGSFYCFTSNCDAHFYDFFPAVDIHDCHGNIELWQCSNRECDSSNIWRAPTDWSIAVSSKTAQAPPTKNELTQSQTNEAENEVESAIPRLGQSKGLGVRENLLKGMPPSIKSVKWNEYRDDETPNWPKCWKCKSLARPAIFMFGDFGWKYDNAQDARWNAWRQSVVELCSESSKPLKVCVLEIGCGKRVSTCRSVSELMIEDLVKTGFGDETCLVRINPDFADVDDERLADYVISIRSKGLSALVQIQEYSVSKQ